MSIGMPGMGLGGPLPFPGGPPAGPMGPIPGGLNLGGPPPPPFPPAPAMMGPTPPPSPMMAGMQPTPQTGLSPTMLLLAAMSQQQEEEAGGNAPDTKPKKPKRKKPNMEEIKERADKTVDFWGLRDTRMDEDLDLYRLTEEATGAGELVLKNTPFVVVEKAANMIASQVPSIQVIPPDNSGRDTAQKIENFLRYSGERWNKQWRRSQAQGSMRHDMAHFLCLRGWVAIRTMYDEDAEESRSHPVQVKLFDPRQVYPAFGDKGLRHLVHRYWTTYGELIDEYPEIENKIGEVEESEHVEVTSYYDDWYHAVYIEELDIKPVTAHEYGFVPWVVVTGNGSPIRATTQSQDSWVRDVGVSIFHGIKSSYRQLNKTLSQLATQVANTANPASIYYYDPTLNKTPQPLDYTAGTTNYLLYDRERVDPLNLSPRPTEVGPLIDSLIDDVQKGSLPSILWGQGGTESGFHTSVLTDAARDQLFTIVEAMQEAFEQMNEYCLMLIRDMHDGDIGFWVKREDGRKEGGVTISAEDIEEIGIDTVVRYRDISPKDRTALANLATLLTDKKLISMETAREEYLLLENPERENERVLGDLIYMDDDVIKKGLVPMTLMNTDPDMFQFYLALKQAELMAGQPPPGGGPGGPGGPPAGPPGVPPTVVPPLAQPGADPMLQSLGSMIGGAGGLGVGPGLPGTGSQMPLGLPLGM